MVPVLAATQNVSSFTMRIEISLGVGLIERFGRVYSRPLGDARRTPGPRVRTSTKSYPVPGIMEVPL